MPNGNTFGNFGDEFEDDDSEAELESVTTAMLRLSVDQARSSFGTRYLSDLRAAEEILGRRGVTNNPLPATTNNKKTNDKRNT